MRHSLENQAISEIPTILAEFLEVAEDQITYRKPTGNSYHDLVVDVDKYTFLVDFKSSGARAPLFLAFTKLSLNQTTYGKNTIPLVVVPYMGEAGQRFCEEHRLSWLDLSGNAHIKAPGILIRVGGRPNRFKKVGRPSNIFAPKSSRIARQLLIEPDRKFTQRELTRATDLDEGFTSRIVHKLEQDKLIVRDNKGAVHAYDSNQLLDAWHEVYDFGWHHIIKGHIAARSGDELLHRIAEFLTRQKIDYAATGLGAAWLLTHFASFRIATFFFRHPPSKKIFGDLGFREEEHGGNTWLVVPNDEGVFYGSEALEGILCVHPVQIYLDLKGHPERASEAAIKLRQEYLTWRQNG